MKTTPFCRLLQKSRALIGSFGLSKSHTQLRWRVAVAVLALPLVLASPHTTVGQPTPPSSAVAAPPAAPASAPVEAAKPAVVAPPAPAVPAPPAPAVPAPPAVPVQPPVAPPPAAAAAPATAVSRPALPTTPPMVATVAAVVPVATQSAPPTAPHSATALPAAAAPASSPAAAVAATVPAGSPGPTTVAASTPLPGTTPLPIAIPGAPANPGSPTTPAPLPNSGSPTPADDPFRTPDANLTPGPAGGATPLPQSGAGPAGLPANPPPLLVTPAGTETIVITATGTPTVVLTATVVPTLVSPITVVSVEPASITNDQPVRIAVSGGGFVNTSYAVRIGDLPLSDVHVDSASALTGTLPAGLCPGVYPATLLGTLGSEVSGGSVAVRSVRNILQNEGPESLNVQLAGRGQRLTVALPPIRIEDSGCETTDWRINFSVGMPSEQKHGKTLSAKNVTVRWAVSGTTSSYGGTANVLLSYSDGHGRGTLILPRLGSTRLYLVPALDLEVPASVYSGSYSATLVASFAD
jgi:hypothetical protein